ncbi:MAG: DUF5343 domain-containing protein [Alphaproteobacteria bacterium]
MAAKLPYMVTHGSIPKILGKIQEARRPDRFTQDFLETKLGHSGGNARAIIPLLKRMAFLASDGTPTLLYDQFRNSDTQGLAMSKGIKNAYGELYDRNEYAHDLTKEKLDGLVTEITGSSKDDKTTRRTVSTFLALKSFADFESEEPANKATSERNGQQENLPPAKIGDRFSDESEKGGSVGFNVSYTINLNLPETTNPEVFNAIFRALRENLLRNQ